MEAHAMAAGKKNATRLGAHLVFVDESGFMMIPPVRRTWAPVGDTPIVRHYYRRDRISVIGGLSVSPERRRLGFYFRMHAKNIAQEEVHDFLMGTSYVVLLTALYVDNGKNLPLWRDLPPIAFWLIPAAIGAPFILRALWWHPTARTAFPLRSR